MQKIILKYYNPVLKISLGKWNQAYFINQQDNLAIKLIPEYYKGGLVYRMPGSSKRFSYKRLKAHLLYKTITVHIKEYKLPF